jgi:hypothetical protein
MSGKLASWLSSTLALPIGAFAAAALLAASLTFGGVKVRRHLKGGGRHVDKRSYPEQILAKRCAAAATDGASGACGVPDGLRQACGCPPRE